MSLRVYSCRFTETFDLGGVAQLVRASAKNRRAQVQILSLLLILEIQFVLLGDVAQRFNVLRNIKAVHGLRLEERRFKSCRLHEWLREKTLPLATLRRGSELSRHCSIVFVRMCTVHG